MLTDQNIPARELHERRESRIAELESAVEGFVAAFSILRTRIETIARRASRAGRGATKAALDSLVAELAAALPDGASAREQRGSASVC